MDHLLNCLSSDKTLGHNTLPEGSVCVCVCMCVCIGVQWEGEGVVCGNACVRVCVCVCVCFYQHISPVAAALIKRMLHAEPSLRPTIADLLTDEFFTSGYVPVRLPTSCLTVAPRFSIAPLLKLRWFPCFPRQPYTASTHTPS